jgi:hypothetical protein
LLRTVAGRTRKRRNAQPDSSSVTAPAPVVGTVLLTWGTATILHPSWLPDGLAGVA